MLIYSKIPGWQPRKLPRTAEMNAKYKNPDNDFSAWKATDAFAPGASTHQGMVYAIQHPQTGEMIYPSTGRCWALGQDKMLEIMSGWCPYQLTNINDADVRARICGVPSSDVRSDVMALVLSLPLNESKSLAKNVYQRGQWPTHYFNNKGLGGIARKTYLSNVEGRLPTNYWSYSEVGHTDEAKKELKAIFRGSAPFDTPKPTRLIERVLQIAAGNNAIVLDSFAGSGTTGQAVLRQNAEDGGNRRFILIELGDYADTITAERMRRVIHGYGEGDKAVSGIDSGFSYYELGNPLFDETGILNPKINRESIMRYVWYTETKTPYTNRTDEHPYLLGATGNTAYYFAYEPEQMVSLTPELLAKFPVREQTTVVYADRNLIPEDALEKLGIVFKQIPRQIARM